MRYRELTEAPIGDLSVHNMDEPGSFPEVDRKLMQSPRHIERIHQRFANVPYTFNLYFVNRPNVEYTRDLAPEDDFTRSQQSAAFTDQWNADVDTISGVRTPEFISDVLGVPIRHDSSAITVVYVSNANEDNTIPLTPWIIAHRFGHAMTDNPEATPPEIRQAIRALPDRGDEIVGSFPLQGLMTMRSARSATLAYADVHEELIAQYLMQGDILLRFPPHSTPTDQEIATLRWTGIRIRDIIERLMDLCVGRVFVAV